MEIASAAIGSEGGHIAGRRLLETMYEARFGRRMPEISIADRGKPYFADNSVYFSISHTRDTVFCVLSEYPVGIDAESIGRNISPRLADKILSAAEKIRYEQAKDKNQALLRLWVLKEAAAKCSGEGIVGYPNGTDFSPEDIRIQIRNGCFVAVVEEK